MRTRPIPLEELWGELDQNPDLLNQSVYKEDQAGANGGSKVWRWITQGSRETDFYSE